MQTVLIFSLDKIKGNTVALFLANKKQPNPNIMFKFFKSFHSYCFVWLKCKAGLKIRRHFDENHKGYEIRVVCVELAFHPRVASLLGGAQLGVWLRWRCGVPVARRDAKHK